MNRKTNDAFSSVHPAVSFYYFAFVMTVSILVMHPWCAVISLFSGAAYAIYLSGGKALRFQLSIVLPLIIITSLINPIFNHSGATPVWYINSKTPVTLEAIVYGIIAAAVFGAALIWFSCFNSVMTSDKLIYLFGRVIPSLSLVITMSLRFVPRFRNKIKEISAAQKSLGRDSSSGNIIKRIKCALNIFSITVTWALEGSVNTADSMKSRGYGLPERTSFSIFKLTGHDMILTGVMAFLSLTFLTALFCGAFNFRFFPVISGEPASLLTYAGLISYLVFCNIPLILNIKEDIVWRSLKSEI